jgi:hypothetical protein
MHIVEDKEKRQHEKQTLHVCHVHADVYQGAVKVVVQEHAAPGPGQYTAHCELFLVAHKGENCSEYALDPTFAAVAGPVPAHPLTGEPLEMLNEHVETVEEAVAKATEWIQHLEHAWGLIRHRVQEIAASRAKETSLNLEYEVMARLNGRPAPAPLLEPEPDPPAPPLQPSVAENRSLATRFEHAVDDMLREYETKKDLRALELACRAHQALIAQRDEDELDKGIFNLAFG